MPLIRTQFQNLVLRWAFALLMIGVYGIDLHAATFNWTNSASDGNWNNSSNWSIVPSEPPRLPGVADEVYIDLGPQAVVLGAVTVTIGSLTIGNSNPSELVISSGTHLTIVNGLSVQSSGKLTMDADSHLTLDPTGSGVDGLFVQNGGLLDGSAAFVISSGGEWILQGNEPKQLSGIQVTNYGRIIWQDTGNWTMGDGAHIESGCDGGTFYVPAAAELLVGMGSASIETCGSFIRNMPPPRKTGRNSSKGTALPGTHIYVDTVFGGGISAVSGDLYLHGNNSYTNVTLDAQSVSRIYFEDNTHTFDNATFTGSGAHIFHSGTASFVTNESVLNSGSVAKIDGANLDGNASFTDNGSIYFHQGVVGGNLTLNVASGGFLIMDTAQLKTIQDFAAVQVGGTLQWTEGPVALKDSSSVNISPYGYFEAGAIDEWNDGGAATAGTVNLSSMSSFNMEAVVGTETKFFVPFNNQGMVDVVAGNLFLNGGGDQTNGQFQVGFGHKIEFNGTSHTFDNTQFQGLGLVLLAGGDFNLQGNSSSSMDTSFGIVGGSLNGAGTFTADGHFFLEVGEIKGGGTLESNGTFRVKTGGNKLIQSFTVNINNEGVFEHGDLFNLDLASINVGGTMVNKSGDGAAKNGSPHLDLMGELTVSELTAGSSLVTLSGSAVLNKLSGAGPKRKLFDVAQLNVELNTSSTTITHVQFGTLVCTAGVNFPFSTVTVDTGARLELVNEAFLGGTIFAGDGEVVLRNGSFNVSGSTSFQTGIEAIWTDATVYYSPSKGKKFGNNVVVDSGASLTWNSGELQNGALLEVFGLLVMDTPAVKVLSSGSEIHVYGKAELLGLGDLQMGDGTKLWIKPAALRKVPVPGELEFKLDADIVKGPGPFTIAAPVVVNEGYMHKSGVTPPGLGKAVFSTQIHPELMLNGSLTVEVGELELRGGGVAGLNSMIQGYSGTKLSIFDATFDLDSNSNLSSLDHLLVGGTELNFGGTYNFNQLTVDTGATVNFDSNGTISRLNLLGVGLGGTAIVTVTDQFDWVHGMIGGSLTLEMGGNGGTNSPDLKTIDGNAIFRIVGDFTWDQGNLEIAGGAQLDIHADGSLTLNSPITISPTVISRKKGPGTQIMNQGLLTIVDPSVHLFELPLQNQGTINLTSGTLELKSISSNSGTISLGTATNFVLNESFQNDSTGIIQGTGLMKLLFGSFEQSGTLDIGVLELNGGSLNLMNFAQVGDLNFHDGLVQGLAGMSVSGNFHWESGTFSTAVNRRGAPPNILVQQVSTLDGVGGRVLNGFQLQLQGNTQMTTGSIEFANAAELINEGEFQLNGSGLSLFGNGQFFNRHHIANLSGENSISATFALDPTVGTEIRSEGGKLSFDNSVTQSKGLVKLQGGDLAFNDTLTLDGGYLIGTGTLYGNLVNNGTVSIQVVLPPKTNLKGKGRPRVLGRILQIEGDYSQSGILNTSIDGPDAGADYDQLSISGTAMLGGTLSVTVGSTYTPPTGHVFMPVVFSNRNGSAFASVNVSPIVSGATLNSTYQDTSLNLVTSGPPVSNWTGTAGDGNWDNPANWQEGVLPGSNSDVYLALNGTYEVHLSSNVQVSHLRLIPSTGSLTFTLNGFDLTLELGLLNGENSTIDLHASNIYLNVGRTGSAQVENHGRIWVRGTCAIQPLLFNQTSGILDLESGSSIAANLELQNGLQNYGDVTMTSLGGATDTFLNSQTGTILNEFGGEFFFNPGDGGIRHLSSGMDNHGILHVSTDTQVGIPVKKRVVTKARPDAESSARQVIASSFSNDGQIYLGDHLLELLDMDFTNLAGGLIEGVGEIGLGPGYRLVNDGEIIPGGIQIGHLRIGGALELGVDSRLLLQLGGLVQGTEYDWLEIDGPVTTTASICGSPDGCGGEFEIESFLAPFLPQYGDEFTPFTFTSFTGAFSTINFAPTPNGTSLTHLYEPQQLRIVTHEPSEVHWAQPISGVWSDPLNWNPEALPGPTTDVFLDASGTYEVILDQDASIGSLTVGGAKSGIQTLVAVGHDLALGGVSRIEPNGDFLLDTSSLSASTIVVRKKGAASLENKGRVTVSGTVSILVPFSNWANARLTQVSGISQNQLRGSLNASLTFAEGFTNEGEFLITNTEVAADNEVNFNSGRLENEFKAVLRFEAGVGGTRTLHTAGFVNRGGVGVFADTTLHDTESASLFSNENLLELFGSQLHLPGRNLTSTSSGVLRGWGGLTLNQLQVDGQLQPQGVDAQSPGEMEINGQLLFTQTANFDAAIFAEVRSGFDALVVNGTATLDGTLNLLQGNGLLPGQGETYDLISATSINGSFDKTLFPELPNNLEFVAHQSKTLYQVQVDSKPDITGLAVFVTHPSTNTVSVIAGGGNATATYVQVGSQPQTPVASGDGSRFWVPCTGSGEIYILDKTQPQVLDVITGLSSPISVAFNSDNSEAWVLERIGSSNNRISIYDPVTHAFIDSFVPASGSMGTAIAYNPVLNQFYIGSDNSGTNLSVIDAETHSQVAGLGFGGDQILAKPPGDGFFVLNGGSVTLVDAFSFSGSLITAPFSVSHMDVSSDGGKLYLVGGTGTVHVYDTQLGTGANLAVSGATGITSVSVLDDLGIGYAADPGENQVFSFDPSSGSLIAKRSGPLDGPTSLASNKSFNFGLPGQLEFSTLNYVVTEGEPKVFVEVRRVGGSSGVLNALLSTQDGTATAPGDYTAILDQLVTFANGDSDPQQFAITIQDDTVEEDDEAFSVGLFDPINRGSSVPFNTATVLIKDNETGELRFSQTVYSVDEGAGSVEITVERIGGHAGPLEALLSTQDGEATAPGDYSAQVNIPVFFAAGDVEPKSFLVSILDDRQPEMTEDFTVGLSSPVSRRAFFAEATVQIIDNEPVGFALPFATAAMSEGDGFFGVQILKIGNQGRTGSVRVVTEDGTALAGLDYDPIDEIISFAPDEQERSVNISVNTDPRMERNEFFTIRIVGVDGSIVSAPNTMVVTIENDDVATVSWAGQTEQTLAEGNNKRTASTILEAVLSAPIDFPVSVSLGVGAEEGNPQFGQDFQLSGLQLDFAEGTQSASVTFSTIADLLVEGNEVVLIALLDGEIEAQEPRDVRLTIQDDDVLAVEWVTAPQSLVEGTGKRVNSLGIQAALSQPATETLVVTLEASGDAVLDEDYTLSSRELTFRVGQATASLQLNVIDDEQEEPAESIELRLVPPQAVVSLNPQIAFSIQANDAVVNLPPETSILSPFDGGEYRVGEEISFAADAIDDGPEPLTYNWEICLTSGGCVNNLIGQTFDYTFTEPGVYDINCVATDGAGLSDPIPAGIRVTLFAENIAPTVEIIDPDEAQISLELGSTRSFTALALDPENEALSYSWYFEDAPDNVFTGETFSHTFDQAGLFTLIVNATDPAGATGEDWVTVEVYEIGQQPTSVRILEPLAGAVYNVGDVVPFVGELITAKRKEFQLYWDKGDGSIVLDGEIQPVTYQEPGDYIVRLSAIDENQRLEVQTTIHIVDPGIAPVIDMNLPGDITIEPSQASKVDETPDGVYLYAIVIDDNGHNGINFFWDLGDNQRQIREATPGRIHYAEEGVYEVELYAVTDSGLVSNVVTRTITVRNTGDEDFEPNESFSQAVLIQPGNYDNLQLNTESNTDYFRVEITRENQTLNLHFEVSEPMVASIFDTNQSLIETRTLGGDGNLQLLGLAVGTYYIRLTASSTGKDLDLSYGMSIDVLNPALYLPGIVTSPSKGSDLGVVNLANQSASVSFDGYDVSGNKLASVAFNLPARGRLHQSAEQLFGDKAVRVAWVQVNSTTDLDGYSRTYPRNRKDLAMVSASKKLTSDLFVPHIAERTAQWFTQAAVINGSDKGKTAEARVPGNTKALGLEKGFASDSFDFLERFGSLPANDAWAVIKESGENLALAGIEIFGRKDGSSAVAGLQLVDNRKDNPSFTYVGNNIIFTHIARDIQNFYTGIALVNLGSIEQGLRIRPYGVEGNELENRILAIGPNQKLVRLAADLLPASVSPAEVDWMLVEADRDVVGFEIFGTQDGKGMAGIEGTTSIRKNLNYPYINTTGNAVHGISLVNPNSGPNLVRIELRNDVGQVLGSVELTLAANQKVVRLVESLFPGTIPSTTVVPGYVSVTGQLPLAGFLLYFSNDREQMGGVLAQ